MELLESIDFSGNQVTGEIPQSITNLNFLNKQDLSYNHLEGKIPTGTQLQSFEASDFVGNKLSGPPLLLNCTRGVCGAVWFGFKEKSHPIRTLNLCAMRFGLDEFFLEIRSDPITSGLDRFGFAVF
ncbi:Phytosulfokine receptor [Arachis hypogaea]|nr:Phytosulfokine receptor [Arachis hypogaea]